MERSLKKIKGGEKPFEPGSSRPISYADIAGSPNEGDNHRVRSYKDSMLGMGGERIYGEEEEEYSDGEKDREWRPDADKEFTGMKVVEKQLGEHVCPDFVLTEEEEARLQKPWRNGVIVKLLGRKIGY
ncbi:hypothetical protein L195_g061260, partial [Trifolium pratense]